MALVGVAPIVSDDVYRYLWDGRVQQHGLNPYESVPDDPGLESLHTDLTRRIHPTNAALPAIYPPLAQRLFYGVTSIHESVEALAIAMVLADVLIIVLLWRWLVAAGRNRWWVLAYAWHPLVVLEGAGGAVFEGKKRLNTTHGLSPRAIPRFQVGNAGFRRVSEGG